MKLTALEAQRYHLDNYVWLLEGQQKTICIDPTQSDVVQKYLDATQKIDEFWITHAHQDHVGGLDELLNQFPKAKVRGSALILAVNQDVQDLDVFQYEDFEVEVWETPGHKKDHVIFILKTDPWQVFCGDIFFSAGCGRVLDGTIKELYNSVMRINQLPAATILIPAHEYTLKNLEFAHYIEPDNQAVSSLITQIRANPGITLPTTLAKERLINPFLRIHETAVITKVQALLPNINSNFPEEVFAGLRQLRNQF